MHTLVSHPLVAHRVALMRAETTEPKLFRELVSEIAAFLAYEALRDLETIPVKVRTPLMEADGVKVSEPVVIVPILRAGIGMMGALLDVVPSAKVGVLGMQRNETTAEPEPYYAKVPKAKGRERAIVIDPMLATGGSAVDAVGQLKKLGYKKIVFLCLISAPEGIALFESRHPDVPIYTSAIDLRLNERKYILPGLGDAGDRIFGTL